ncbi:MAG TPA: tetratricopeptide repeat protein [Candidatus Baltobacteraceae bacterium]|nr:tetratricopeptide repeat protein [Candidatus Baltobacteraceae bacterium]
MEWGLREKHDVALGAAIAGSLERLWSVGGLSAEARFWIETALEQLIESEHSSIAARLYLAKARFLQGQPMRECAQRAFVLYKSLGDRRGAGYALRSLAYSLLQMGEVDEANNAIAEAISQLRDLGDKAGVASCLGLQGVNAYTRGNFAMGRAFYSQALEAYRELKDELSAANVLGNLAELEFADGNPEEALRLVSESLAITSRGREATELAIDLNNMAAYSIAVGDLEQARISVEQALRSAQPDQNAWNIAVALQHCALLVALHGETECAARLLGYVDAQYRDLALQREATEKWGYQKLMTELREKAGDAELQSLCAEGATWTEERAVHEALAFSRFPLGR